LHRVQKSISQQGGCHASCSDLPRIIDGDCRRWRISMGGRIEQFGLLCAVLRTGEVHVGHFHGMVLR
jgi:hypothetical protein